MECDNEDFLKCRCFRMAMLTIGICLVVGIGLTALLVSL